MPKRITTDSFIEQAKTKHNDYYDYSVVSYKGSLKPVVIVCPKHGEFYQIASYHLTGNGCKECAIKNKSHTSNQFRTMANKVHNSKYDYNEAIYKNTHTKVEIICNTHGSFRQRPMDHLRGSGCPTCKKTSTDQFIDSAILIHGLKYDYTNVQYLNQKKCVELGCNIHGRFKQTPYQHLRFGCMKCHATRKQQKRKQRFVEQAGVIHDQIYSYDKVDYNGTHTRVVIVCPKHGEFHQKPNSHISGGHGCKYCKCVGGYDLNRLVTDNELGSSNAVIYLIKLTNESESFYKIGISNNIKSRLYGFSGYTITVLSTAEMTLLNAFKLEQNILTLYYNVYKYIPLNMFNGYTECMQLPEETLTEIQQILNDMYYNEIILLTDKQNESISIQ